MAVAIALDVGERRTGVAIGSTESGLARPHSVLRMAGREALVQRIRQLIDESGAELVVVGCPLQMDGTVSPQGERIRRFVDGFSAELGVPTIFWNEAYSSVEAQALLIGSGKSRKRRRQQEDAVAAAVVLGEYLEARRRGSTDGRPASSVEGG